MRSIVLLSSGLDSVVNLAIALEKSEVQAALTFDYGQKAAKRELYFSAKIASYYGVENLQIKLPFYKKMKELGLIKGKVPWFRAKDLEEKEIARRKALQVWVPNRNLVFVSIAGAFAEYFKVDLLVTGFNQEESQSFPDNSSDFLAAVNQSLAYSTQNKVKVISYTISMNKKEILKEGIKRKIPWRYLWSCYLGLETMCGQCESCQRLIRAAKNSEAWKELQLRFKNA